LSREKRVKLKRRQNADTSKNDVNTWSDTSFPDVSVSEPYKNVTVDLPMAVERFLEKLPARRRKPFLKLLCLWCNGSDVDSFLEKCRDRDFLVESIVNLVEKLKSEDLAPKTISGFYIPMLKRFLKFHGLKVDWDAVKVKADIPKKFIVKIDRAPTVGELRQLIMASNERISLMIHFMAATGLRVSELLNLKVENLDFSSNPPMVRIISAKTGRMREVPLTSEVVERLRKYLGNRKSGYLFTTRDGEKIDEKNFLRDFMKLTFKLGLNQRDPSGRGWMLHPYSLRKFFKTRLEEAGVNMLVIETWMGHDLNVSGSYFRPSKRMIMEEWRKAEKALTIFQREDEDKTLENLRKIQELERELSEMKRLLNYLLARLRESHSRLGA